jgi:hypothetical protein
MVGIMALTVPWNAVRMDGAIAVSDAFLAVGVVLLVARNAVQGAHRPSQAEFHGLIAGVCLIISGGLVGGLLSYDPVASLTGLAKFSLSVGGMILLCVHWRPTEGQLRRVAWLFIGGTLISFGYGLASGPVDRGDRIYGLSTHPNHFALTCVIAVALGLGMAFDSRSSVERRLAVVSITIASLGVLDSGSRSGLAALLVLVVMFVALRRRGRALLIVGFASAALVVALGLGFVHLPEFNAVDRLIGASTSPASADAYGSDVLRSELQSAAWSRIKAHPLTGSGFNANDILDSHSSFLIVWQGAGVLGLAGFAVTARSVLIPASRVILRRRASAMLISLTSGYVAYLVFGIQQNIAWERYLWFAIALIPAVVNARGRGAISPSPRGDGIQMPVDRIRP